jgi:protein SOK2
VKVCVSSTRTFGVIGVHNHTDNHMINGTKLLNVAGMTRGRRDGILKSEKVRHVVKIGPMHLKGVWIPFERALDFANKEKITELLYPLFVHNIGAFLYHPTNSGRTQAVMAAAAQRRRQDTEVLQQSQALGQGQMQRRNPTDIGTQPPPLHHPSMHNPLHTTLPPHSSLTQPGRPGIERSMSFPTPPSSASSVMGVGSSDGWSFSNGNMVPAVPGSGSQSLAIDTVMNSRSMPTTPATTPPGGPMQQLNQYPPPTSSVYPSNSSSMSQQNIAQQNMQRFSQPVPQSSQYMNQEVQHGDEEGDNEAEHDHDEEYTTHDGNYTNGHRSGV